MQNNNSNIEQQPAAESFDTSHNRQAAIEMVVLDALRRSEIRREEPQTQPPSPKKKKKRKPGTRERRGLGRGGLPKSKDYPSLILR